MTYYNLLQSGFLLIHINMQPWIMAPHWAENFGITIRKNKITILFTLVVLMLIGVIPAWPYNKSWGYGPCGGVGLVLSILFVLFLMGS